MGKKRLVLAYSGGLDTSVAVKWLSVELGYEVVAVSVDVGQGGDFDELKERATQAGAVAVEVIDAKDEFANEYVLPAIRANALYEGKYPLVSSLSRPIIAKHLVNAAKRHSAQAVAHGCTGKGNDQVRFEVSIRALNPNLEIVAPVRTWGFSREDSIDYAAKHDVRIKATKEKLYSIDQNLWGRAIECGEMEDPWVSPPKGVYEMTIANQSEPSEVIIGFEKGKPTSINGRPLPLVQLIDQLNLLCGSYGIGRIDMVENRRVGIKSREVYEAPAAIALIAAHSDLEDVTLERELAHEKRRIQNEWSRLVYDGMWFSPLKVAYDSFLDYSQTFVTGEVRLVLEPNAFHVEGRRSPHSLYDYSLATYDSTDLFRHQDAEGFVRIFGLGVQTWASKQGKLD
ncbi:MAG: argininosuccinate synthase [Acidimicrobiaceae bacterium]|nr:argininosuccinate synthase [Acidimicrobiaceae bacterium]